MTRSTKSPTTSPATQARCNSTPTPARCGSRSAPAGGGCPTQTPGPAGPERRRPRLHARQAHAQVLGRLLQRQVHLRPLHRHPARRSTSTRPRCRSTTPSLTDTRSSSASSAARRARWSPTRATVRERLRAPHHRKRVLRDALPRRRQATRPTARQGALTATCNIPRCKHCGGGTQFVRFTAVTNGKRKPRLWARCKTPMTDNAPPRSSRSTAPKTGRRRGTETVQPTTTTASCCHSGGQPALPRPARAAHQLPARRVHDRFRTRYGVAPDSKVTRPKRRGAAWQQLRSNAALIADWLIVCARQGWLRSGRRPQPADKEQRLHGRAELDSFLTTRHELGLHLRRRPRLATPARTTHRAGQRAARKPPPDDDRPF